mgnify:CR=1 FL=1|jgi:hypothetical protein
MKNKRGQYYLIAAMIIIVILASFISVINFASKNSNDPMKEIEKELNNEIEEILNYATMQDLSSIEYKNIFKNMSSNYISKFSGKTTIFLYGDKTNLTVKGKNSYNETLTFSDGNGFTILKTGVGEFEENYLLLADTGILKMEDVEHSFQFPKGQGFYYLISNRDGGENNLIRG